MNMGALALMPSMGFLLAFCAYINSLPPSPQAIADWERWEQNHPEYQDPRNPFVQ